MEPYQKNIYRLNAFAFFQTFLVLIPVIIPYWQELGLSLREIFTLQAVSKCATTNSIGSLGMRALFIAFGPWLGRILDEKGAAPAMATMGWVYVIGLFLIAMPLLSQRREFKIN